MADAESQQKSVSKNFKRKGKGKSDDKKLKVKPKTFPKEIKTDSLVGVKRKGNDTDGVGTKKFKTKKWKGEEQHDTRKKGLLGNEKENKESDSKVKQKFIKDSKKKSEKGKFDSDKTRKRKLDADGGQRDSVKKKKSSEVEEGSDDKPNIWQMKKKERKDFRRRQNEDYDLVHDLKQLYETIRRKKSSKAKKTELVERILNLIAGHSHQVIFKHDTGRVIQCCVKFGTSEQRQKLFEQFKDDLGELIKSKYSKFLVKNFLNYGTKKQRDVIIKCFYGQVRKLIRHKEAASILETIYSEYANAEQKAFLIQEFYGADFAFFKSPELNSLEKLLTSEPARKSTILKFMKEALLPLIDRSVIGHSIVHRVLLEYLTYADTSSQLEMIEMIKESVVLILHTHDGARVGMHCLWHGTTKDRKVLIKSFKGYYVKICKEEFGHMVLLALFDCVDDTVLVKKNIIPEILPSLHELALDTYGRKVLMYLLLPRCPAHFHPFVVELLKKGDGNSTSKKDPKQRRQELLEGISSVLLQMVEKSASELLFDKGAIQLVGAALAQCTGDVKPAMIAISNLVGRDLDPTTADEDHVIKSAAGHLAIKRLIIHDNERLQSGSEGHVFFSKLLLENIKPGAFFEWCKINRGAFVVVSLLESSVPGVSEAVKAVLQSRVSKLKKFESKGLEVVLKLLET